MTGTRQRRRFRCVACNATKLISVAPIDADRQLHTGCEHCGAITTHDPVGGRKLRYYRSDGDEGGGR
jgi:transcription elongation factor Elf1